MNKDEIIRLARKNEALSDPEGIEYFFSQEDLIAFANLVAAHVMAQPCCGNFATCQQACMPKGAAVERETIAQMFDAIPELVSFARRGDGGCIMCGFAPKMAAKAIRKRNNHDQL